MYLGPYDNLRAMLDAYFDVPCYMDGVDVVEDAGAGITIATLSVPRNDVVLITYRGGKYSAARPQVETTVIGALP